IAISLIGRSDTVSQETGRRSKQRPRRGRKVAIALGAVLVLLIGAGVAVLKFGDAGHGNQLAVGRALLEKGDARGALIAFKSAVRDQPNNVDARLDLGALSLRLGDSASAEKEYTTA